MIRPQLREFLRRMAPKSVAIIPGAHDTRRGVRAVAPARPLGPRPDTRLRARRADAVNRRA